MGQQISIEDALAAFRKRCGELTDENVLLKAHTTVLERQLEGAEKENALLRKVQEETQPTATYTAPDEG